MIEVRVSIRKIMDVMCNLDVHRISKDPDHFPKLYLGLPRNHAVKMDAVVKTAVCEGTRHSVRCSSFAFTFVCKASHRQRTGEVDEVAARDGQLIGIQFSFKCPHGRVEGCNLWRGHCAE